MVGKWAALLVVSMVATSAGDWVGRKAHMKVELLVAKWELMLAATMAAKKVVKRVGAKGKRRVEP